MATPGLHLISDSARPALQDMWCIFNEMTFTCAMCNNSVEEATFLSCLHSFCLKCIQNGKEDEFNEFNCPCCREKHSYLFLEMKNNLPSLFRRLQSLSKTDSDDVIFCESCINRNEPFLGVAYCLECSTVICEIELECHRKYGLKHRIIYFNDLKDWTGNDILTRLRKCNTAQLLLHESNDNVGNNNDDDDGGVDSDDGDDSDNNITFNMYTTTTITNNNNTITNSNNTNNNDDDDDSSDDSDGTRGCNNTIVYDVSGTTPSIESVYSLGESCLCSMKRRVEELEGKKRAIEEEWSDELIKLNGVFDDMKQLLEQRRLECVAEVETLYQELIDPFCNQIEYLSNDIQLMEYYTALSAYSYISDVTSGVCSKMIKLTNSFACLAPPVKAFKPKLKFENSILSLQSSIKKFLKYDFIKENPAKFTPISFRKDSFLKFKMDSSHLISPILSVDYDSSTGQVYVLYNYGWKAFHCFDDGQLVIVSKIELHLDSFSLGNVCSLLVLPDYVVISGIASKHNLIEDSCIHVFSRTGSLIHYFPSFHKKPKLYKIFTHKYRFLSIEHNVGICHFSIKGDVIKGNSLDNLIDISVDVDGEHIYVLLSYNEEEEFYYELHYYNIYTLKRVESGFMSLLIPSYCLIFPISPKMVMLYKVYLDSAVIYNLSVTTGIEDACLQSGTSAKAKFVSIDVLTPFITNNKSCVIYHDNLLYFIN